MVRMLINQRNGTLLFCRSSSSCRIKINYILHRNRGKGKHAFLCHFSAQKNSHSNTNMIRFLFLLLNWWAWIFFFKEISLFHITNMLRRAFPTAVKIRSRTQSHFSFIHLKHFLLIDLTLIIYSVVCIHFITNTTCFPQLKKETNKIHSRTAVMTHFPRDAALVMK